MRTPVVHEALVLGALTGMRSMAGPAVLAWRRGGIWPRLVSTLAAGEMGVDKTSIVGDRTDAVPLTGRAVMGAAVGGLIAGQARENVVWGALIGAAAAVAMAHVAWHARRRLPLSQVSGGLLEDAIVVAAGAWYARRPA